jgi:hypothetical protein
MMKKLMIFTGIMALLFLTMPGNALSKSAENKAACESWCNDNKPQCIKCDSNAFCDGRTLDVIKSFKKGTGNWYACGLSEYAAGSLKNKTDCEAWCKTNEQCEFCKDTVGCGARHTSIRKFGGKGKNWYACSLTKFWRESAKNKDDCDKFCDNSPLCDFCAASPACRGEGMSGMGGEIVEKFKGYGDNWYACRFTAKGLLTKERKAECEKMCTDSVFCDYCTAAVCRPGSKVVARLRGRGDTVYACKKR